MCGTALSRLTLGKVYGKILPRDDLPLKAKKEHIFGGRNTSRRKNRAQHVAGAVFWEVDIHGTLA